MRTPDALHPLSLAAADIALGSLLYAEVSVALGTAFAAIGVLILCSAARRVAERDGMVERGHVQQG